MPSILKHFNNGSAVRVHSGSLSTMGMAFLRVPLGMTTGRREPRGSGGSKNIVKETIYQPRPLLSQIHTTIYIPFTRKARLFENNSEPVGGGRPLVSATAWKQPNTCRPIWWWGNGCLRATHTRKWRDSVAASDMFRVVRHATESRTEAPSAESENSRLP